MVADEHAIIELFREGSARQTELAAAKKVLASSTRLGQRFAWTPWCWPLAYFAPGLVLAIVKAYSPGIVVFVVGFWPLFLLFVPFGERAFLAPMFTVLVLAAFSAWLSHLRSSVESSQMHLKNAETSASKTEQKLEILRQSLASVTHLGF